ncbi:hypothetical protein WA026_003689 [Henosepilachna vigintioctopunctata]|uniref:Fatty acid desaturase domain-containing protein n=1 Tax=Henosepilachna vigintioctopunctata TaxID=420089 RepID=A0AAW1UFD3_9CUCU
MSTTLVEGVVESSTAVCDHSHTKKKILPSEIGTDYSFKRKIVWKNVFAFVVLHLGALYGLYLGFFEAKWLTIVFVWFLIFATGEGITAGAHRLYSHKSYKATLPLRVVLLILQTIAGQNCMYIWARDHRQHHKYSDTDADPHNANRGFFFSHMGWLMSKKHPMVIAKGKTIDMSDLEADALVMFQKKYYNPLYFFLALVFPVYLPVYLWNETAWTALFTCYFLRYVALLHITWTVNSIAHYYGTKPFDMNIVAVESKIVSLWAGGEGWHNYHHTFPWDYKASEFAAPLNATTTLIDIMAYFGLAYDMREASISMIQKRIKRTGDGSHAIYGSKKVDDNHNNEMTKMQ